MGVQDTPPGRELDKIMARLMGWTWDEDTARSPSGDRNWRKPTDPWWWLPYYSTEIQAAWELAEKFKLFIMPYGKDAWMVTDRGDLNDPDCLTGFGDSTPFTICLVALRIARRDNKLQEVKEKSMKTRIPIGKLLDAGATVLTAVDYERDSVGVTVKTKTTIDLPYLDDEKYNEKLRVWTALLSEAGVDFLHRQGMSGLRVEEEWALEDD